MDKTVLLLYGLVAFVVWFAYITRPSGDCDDCSLKARLGRAWRRLAFWAGDLKVIPHFPFMTWYTPEHGVGHGEFLQVMRDLRAGDVVLTKKNGYVLSNTAIPGVFKHAAMISVGPICHATDYFCDVTEMRLVEAVSEGVVERCPLDALADLMIVLRPKTATPDETKEAVNKACRIVGQKYDSKFEFDIEEELEKFATNIAAEYDMAFSCTEVVAFAWWHKRHELRLYRKKARGRDVIVADQLVNRGFDIIWTNVDPILAKKKGLSEEGVEMIREYWAAVNMSN